MVQKLKEIHKIQKNFRKLLLFSIFFCIFINGKVLCQSKIQLDLQLGGGTNFAIFDKGFLEQYNEIIGGRKEDFLHQFSPNIGLYVGWNNTYQIGLNVELINFALKENFIKETFIGSGLYRAHFEEIQIKSLPVLLSVKYADFGQKYRSFIEIGVGMSYSEMIWNEEINSPIPYDIITGGNICDDVGVYPSMLAKLGVELLFDKGSVPKFINGINLSTEIIYTARYIKVFDKLIKQYYNSYSELDKKQGVVPFVIGLNLGIIFNIDNTKINRVFGS